MSTGQAELKATFHGGHDQKSIISDGADTDTLVDLTSSASLHVHAASLKSLELQDRALGKDAHKPSILHFRLPRRVGTLLSTTRTKLFVQAPLAVQYEVVMTLRRNFGCATLAETTIKQHVLPACVERLGPKHSQTLIVREALGHCAYRAGRYAEAREAWQETWEGRKEVLGREDLATLRAQYNFGLALSELGSFAEAEEMVREVVALHEKVKGRTDVWTLRYRAQVAVVVHHQWRYEEAKEITEELLEEQEKAGRANRPDVLLAKQCHILAIYNLGGDHKLAEESLTKLLRNQTKVHGKKHPNTLATQLSVAHAIARQGREEEAETIQRKVLETQEKVLGKDHPHTQKTRRLLS